MRKKIVWITADYFADCDFLPIEQILKEYDITWIVLLPKIRARFKESDFYEIQKRNPNTLKILFHYSKYRGRDPRYFITVWQLINKVKAEHGQLFYINIGIQLPYYSLLWNRLPHNKCIITAHQGEVHNGFKLKWLAQWSRKQIYSTAKHINMFSNSQAALMRTKYPQSNIYIIPLSLKDFGKPTIQPACGQDKTIYFLSFGQITYNKNIELLIDAACKLKEMGFDNFKVKIAGYASPQTWKVYQDHIKYPKLFVLDIRLIDNDEIPNLFTGSHYFVQPYRIVTQSGAMKVAYNYGTPVIVSDLPGFNDELKLGITGFKFHSESLEDLISVMKERIESHKSNYDLFRKRMKEYIQIEYSPEVIGEKYIKMFKSIE